MSVPRDESSPEEAEAEANGLRDVNALSEADARAAFLHTCGSTAFARTMAAARPFSSLAAMKDEARAVWGALGPSDWDEAFRAHPEIGGKKAEGPQTAASASWSAGEQSKVGAASSDVRAELADVNAKYRQIFGRIYIVCATGKSAEELLAIAKSRLANDPATELSVAAAEQAKITELRLDKLVHGRNERDPERTTMKSVSTHILDTTLGRPAANVPVAIEKKSAAGWERIGGGLTDADGRIKDLVPAGKLEVGIYRVTFDTTAYYNLRATECFYPEVTISFQVRDAESHYHVPLLVSPFGYSTYRGS